MSSLIAKTSVALCDGAVYILAQKQGKRKEGFLHIIFLPNSVRNRGGQGVFVENPPPDYHILPVWGNLSTVPAPIGQGVLHIFHGVFHRGFPNINHSTEQWKRKIQFFPVVLWTGSCMNCRTQLSARCRSPAA
jgi:hypothetical protein